MIRLARIGKKKQPYYRLVVSEKARDLYGRHLEILGNYNPRTKKAEFKKDRVLHWLKMGAQASNTVHNLLVSNKIIEGGKIKVSKISKKRAEKQKKKTVKRSEKKAEIPDKKAADNAPEKSKEKIETPIDTPQIEPDNKPKDAEKEQKSGSVDNEEKETKIEENKKRIEEKNT